MKKISHLTVVVLFCTLFSCGDDEPTPNQNVAEFRVEYSHDGDLDKFVKSFEIGTGFIDQSTNQDALSTFLDDDLKDNSYSFITKADKPNIHLSITAGWLPTTGSPASMTSKVVVFRNGQLLDTQSFTSTDVDVSSVHILDYSAQ